MKIRSLLPSALLGPLACALAFPGTAAETAMRHLGAADQSASTRFNVYLPLTHVSSLEQLLRDQTDANSPSYHQWLTPAQFKEQFGPSRETVARTKAILEANGFQVTAERAQSLEVRGSVAAVERLFSTHLERVQTQGGHMTLAAANHGHLAVPAALAELGAVIPEFAPHLAAHVHSRQLDGSRRPLTAGQPSGAAPQDRLANFFSIFYANDLKEAYQAPSFRALVTPLFSRRPVQMAGTGTTIGIVISSVIDPVDLAASFDSTVGIGPILDVQNYSSVSNLPVPKVKIHRIDGGSGPFDPNTSAGAEASLDTQMSLGTAPGAREILYDMADLSDASITDAYTAVVEENKADVVSSSFGECELDFTAAANGGEDFTYIIKQQHAIFQQGNAQGMTFFASTGDNGAPECTSIAFDNNPSDGTSFVLGVSTPASDPNVTAVGGTNLQSVASPTADDVAYLSENADFDPRLPAEFTLSNGKTVTVDNNTWGSGGGISILFNKPAYQYLVKTGSNSHRTIPDVSLMMGGCPGDADLNAQDCTALPRSGVIVWIGEAPAVLIGTSASAPEMAAVTALAVERAGTRLGNINPLIYSLSATQTALGGTKAPQAFQYFHRNISGDNNGYTVKPGQAYSEVLGNGTLVIKNFLQLQQSPAAGAPGTPSNP